MRVPGRAAGLRALRVGVGLRARAGKKETSTEQKNLPADVSAVNDPARMPRACMYQFMSA